VTIIRKIVLFVDTTHICQTFFTNLFLNGAPYMIYYEIPDPFQTFVAKKYANAKGLVYDFFAKEWYLKTACCGEDLYAPSKKIMTKIRLYHTRNECTGGW
jgi:hypothetical protein